MYTLRTVLVNHLLTITIKEKKLSNFFIFIALNDDTYIRENVVALEIQ